MKILLDILNFDFENYDLSDYLKSIKENFPLSEIYVKEKNRINIDLLKYYNIKDYNNNCDILIFFKNNEKSHNPQTTKFKFNFYFDLSYPWWSYRLRTNNDESHDLIDPDQKQTVFGRLGNRNSDEIFYFPYSFLFRCSGLGPIDKYGFRKKKHSFNSKNIMIFGGSACWGYNVLQSESFPELLEEKLNKNSQNQNFKIFNFAQHSYLLNDQFIAFLLHYKKIKPQIVIMHDGFNDLQFGMISDKNMIRDQITYTITHEYLSNKLYKKSSDVLTHGNSEKMKVLNTPKEVIKTYYEQKQLIKKMIEGLGIKFYSTLQPFLFSKNKLSDYENNYIKKYDIKNSTYGDPYNSCKYLYDKISESDYRFDINFHEEFSKIEEDIFIDFCHLNKKGENIISEIYFNFLKDKL